jgi:hypothetical protein
MRGLFLGKLDRRIRAQREQVATDARRLEEAVRDLPVRAARAAGSPAGLLFSFSLGIAAGGSGRPDGAATLMLMDLLKQAALNELSGGAARAAHGSRRGSPA